MIMRVLLNMANGYEPNSTAIVKDRFNEYRALQKEQIQVFKNAQTSL